MMVEQKWIEFSKKAVPEMEKLASLVKEYGISSLSASFSADGYSDCFCITDDERHFSLTKLYDNEPDYKVKVNQITIGKIPKELQ